MTEKINNTNALVAYLDILGYSKLIKNGDYANDDNNLVKEIIDSKAAVPGMDDLVKYQDEAFIHIPEFNEALV